MRTCAVALSVVIFSACNATPDDSLAIADGASSRTQATPTPSPSASPTPEPSSTPVVHAPRSLLSTWSGVTSNGHAYTVDLSEEYDNSYINVKDLDPSEGILVQEGQVHFDIAAIYPLYRCAAHVDIVGSEDNGLLTVTQVNSGSPATNTVYCNALLGEYEYTATVDGYRLDRGGTLFYWE